MLKVIKAVYGIETVKKMIDVNASDDDYEITGSYVVVTGSF